MGIEREGLLEMKNVKKDVFKKKRFTLTPEVLIYHAPGDKGKLIYTKIAQIR